MVYVIAISIAIILALIGLTLFVITTGLNHGHFFVKWDEPFFWLFYLAVSACFLGAYMILRMLWRHFNQNKRS